MTYTYEQQVAVASALSVQLGRKARPVGSCKINGVGKDIDLLVDNTDGAITALAMSLGFTADSEGEYDEEEFTSLRRGEINLILANDGRYLDAFLAGVDVCCFVRIMLGGKQLTKEERVNIHELIYQQVVKEMDAV